VKQRRYLISKWLNGSVIQLAHCPLHSQGCRESILKEDYTAKESMNYQNLYPIVHDLSEIDTNGCCSMGFQRNGCFSFQDLVDPSFSTMSIDPDEEYVTRGARVGAYDLSDRHRSEFLDRTSPRNALRSLIDDDRNDVATQEKVQSFDEVYVLTRQVSS
jgi:hypothetical protein